MIEHREVLLLDLTAQHGSIREEVLRELLRVIDSQRFILGEEVAGFEREIADYCSARFAAGCASGSDALYLALMAAGVGAGDEVLTTPYTFFATAGAIHQIGARPVFSDVEAETFNLDMNRVEDALRAHPGIRAVIPVHLFGGCADMDALGRLIGERPVTVIEDAAQAIGAEYKGRRAGSLGKIGCFSFFPSKNLGGYGDGGLLTTDDEKLAARLRGLRVHGSIEKYHHRWAGINSRLDALQAVVLRVKLRHLDTWTAARQHNAERYRTLLAELGAPVAAPRPAAYQTRHVYNQFVILCQRRDSLREYLREHGITTEIYYPLPLHLQECFRGLGYRAGDFPVSERLAATSLALPVYPELPGESLEFLCQMTARFYKS